MRLGFFIEKIIRSRLILVLAFGLLLLAAGVIFIYPRISAKPKTPSAEIAPPVATTQIKRTFTATALSVPDKEESELEVTLTSAELKPQIRYKGNPLSAPNDKLFLLIRFEYKNDAPVRVGITTADLIRLIREGKPFAPDYHNATVVVDPVAVKNDQLAFIVGQDLRQFDLLLGAPEEEEKEQIRLSFK